MKKVLYIHRNHHQRTQNYVSRASTFRSWLVWRSPYLSLATRCVPLLLYEVTWLCKPNSNYSGRRQLYTDPIMKSLGFVSQTISQYSERRQLYIDPITKQFVIIQKEDSCTLILILIKNAWNRADCQRPGKRSKHGKHKNGCFLNIALLCAKEKNSFEPSMCFEHHYHHCRQLTWL